LIDEVTKLCEAGRFDILIIEATGISEPVPIATAFAYRDEHGKSLDDIAYIDNMVTVVDTARLAQDFWSRDFVQARDRAVSPDDKRTIVELLVDQVVFADTIILNKISSATLEQRKYAHSIIRGLNADATVYETDFGKLDLAKIIGVKRYDREKAALHPLLKKELEGFKDHVPETEEYGITSFVYRARRPFHAQRFANFLGSSWGGVLRAKGFFWLASRPRWVGELSHCGALVRTSGRSWWWSAMDPKSWPSDVAWRRDLEAAWDPQYGDRKQELVFIGCGLSAEDLKKRLDDCLTDSLPSRNAPDLRDEPDCFPVWLAKADESDAR